MLGCRFILIACVLILVFRGPPRLYSQYKTKKKPVSPNLIIDQTDLIYNLLESFELVRKANDGDARAQHEFGVRYLVGKGFEADTVKAFYWIGRAASSGYPRANYNLGVFYNNAWGTAWDPFKGYRQFRIAAERNMPEAEYTIALILTENLVVPRDLDESERWLRKATDQGLDVATSALRELEQRRREQEKPQRRDTSTAGPLIMSDTTTSKIPPFMFLDAQSDSLADIDDPENLERLFKDHGPQLMKALGIPDEAIDTTKTGRPAEELIQTTADVGSPEARILLGRCHELGRGCQQDVVRAAVYYLSAVRLDSPKAAQLLWDLTQTSDLLSTVEEQARARNNDARYVLAGLSALRFDFRITEEQSVQLLEQAGQDDHLESLLELGVRYSSGRAVPQNRQKAIELWERASSLGSREANVRLVAADIFSTLTNSRSPTATKRGPV
jgi:TPR repeat protein